MADQQLTCVECHIPIFQASFAEQVFTPSFIPTGEVLYCPIYHAGPLCPACYFQNHKKKHR